MLNCIWRSHHPNRKDDMEEILVVSGVICSSLKSWPINRPEQVTVARLQMLIRLHDRLLAKQSVMQCAGSPIDGPTVAVNGASSREISMRVNEVDQTLRLWSDFDQLPIDYEDRSEANRKTVIWRKPRIKISVGWRLALPWENHRFHGRADPRRPDVWGLEGLAERSGWAEGIFGEFFRTGNWPSNPSKQKKNWWAWFKWGIINVISLGKFDHDLTVLPHWKSWLVREIIPKWP